MIFHEAGGESSNLGEVYYAEADRLTGPWAMARKVVTHEKYSFYNPKQHPMFDQENGRLIYFEGTYTAAFSRSHQRTPRYDYNQIMYRLDLSDPRLALPVAIYRQTDGRGRQHLVARTHLDPARPWEVAFFALDRPAVGAVPVAVDHQDGELVLVAGQADDREGRPPCFFGYPAQTKAEPLGLSLDAQGGFAGRPIAQVWRWTGHCPSAR
jgi:hypothetical protein